MRWHKTSQTINVYFFRSQVKAPDEELSPKYEAKPVAYFSKPVDYRPQQPTYRKKLNT